MKHVLTLSVALCLVSRPCAAQMPPTCMLIDAGFFTSSWGGVTETPDGGVAFTGGYDPTNAGHSDVVLTKLDASGALQWIKTYSTGSLLSEYSRAILTTSDGGMAIAGHLEVGQVFIMKLDAYGVPQWTKTYDVPGQLGYQMADGFVQLADGGFALTSTSQFLLYDAWFMLRTSANGDVLWSDELDYVGGYPMDVAALPNGDLLFIGDQGDGLPSAILRKDGLSGDTEWMRWYTTGSNHSLNMRSLVTASDSTIVVTGYEADVTYLDAFAMALSADGTPLWATRIGTDEHDYGDNIARAPNGDYLIAGWRSQDTVPSPQLGRFIMRLDPNGQLLWSKNLTHPDALYIWPVRCAAASDGGVLITGSAGTSTNYPQSFIKLDANGNTCPYCPSVDLGEQNTLVVTLAPDQGSAFAGSWATAADFTFTIQDITSVITSASCGTTAIAEETSSPQVIIAPNPFSDRMCVTLEGLAAHTNAWIDIMDLLGKVVRTERLEGQTTTIPRGTISSGQYAYTVSDERGVIARGVLQVADR